MDFKTLFQDALIAIIPAASVWIFQRKKNRAESASLELKNMQTIFDTYKSELDFMKKRINELEKTVENQDKVIISLKSELSMFENKYGKQSKKIKQNVTTN